MKTYHDVIPISCLTEFPNVVQMAKVGGAALAAAEADQLWPCDHFVIWVPLIVSLLILQLVCEEVNVDRFFPVLYPKVSS